MRHAHWLLAAALVSSCGSAQLGARVERYRISLPVPGGRDADVSRGIVRIEREV